MMTPESLGKVFENKVADEFRRLGFEVYQDCYTPTYKGYTQIDIIATRPGQYYIVECKNWSGLLDAMNWIKFQGGQQKDVIDFTAQQDWHLKTFGQYLNFPVFSLIIVNNNLKFKDGYVPPETIYLRDLESYVNSREWRVVIPKEIEVLAVQLFEQWSSTDKEVKKQHRNRLKDRYDPPEVLKLP